MKMHIKRKSNSSIKGKKNTSMLLAIILLVIMQACAVTADVSNAEVTPPPWAPYYDDINYVHYYYLPDIEVYYDLQTQEFVYLDNGNWIFSHSLPPAYAGYDLFKAHIIILNRHAHTPWMFHHLYLSHYPRYYYNSVHRDLHIYHRGYNENGRRPVENSDRKFENSGTRQGTYKGTSANRPQQPAIYKGKEIGQPVKPPKVYAPRK